jgi:hypothetical protein
MLDVASGMSFLRIQIDIPLCVQIQQRKEYVSNACSRCTFLIMSDYII